MAVRRGLARLRDRRHWPVRWWLSLVTAAIAGGTLLILGGLLLGLLDGSLQRQLAEYLRSQAQPVLERELGPRPPRALAVIVPPQPPIPPTPPSPPVPPAPAPRRSGRPSEKPRTAALQPDGPVDPRLRELAATLIRELAGRETGIVVYDLQHRLVEVSNPGPGVERWPSVPRDALDTAARGIETERVVRQGRRRTLTVLVPLQPSDGPAIGVMGISTGLDLVDALRNQLTVVLAMGTVLAVVVAGGIAAWTTRAALGPLDQMIRTTRRVAGGDLSARVDLRREDEVGELGAAFDRMVERLEATFAAQRRLVSDAAHELRTPLNGLAGTLEIVQVGLARGDLAGASRLLAGVESELDRVARLVNDLLTLSGLDERSPAAMTTVALAPVVRDVVRRMRILAPDHEIVIRADDGAHVHGNRDHLERLLTNLLDNAVKYTPAGGRVEVEARRQGAEVCLGVRDTGRGIPSDDLPRIFDRFYRADRARSRQEGGTGLGLAIVQAIVQAHGGRIDAESTVGGGTTIRVWLPATVANADAPAAAR
jgi:heavy metal sensor kinase